MKKALLTIVFAGLVFSCSEKGNSGSVDVVQEEIVSDEPVNTTENGIPANMNNKGIGPISSVTLNDEIDETMVVQGQEAFVMYCTACHKPDSKLIGPAPKDILERRSPEWVMNMILNPEQMTAEDPIGKQLLIEANGSPMANQHLTEEEARAVLEYFRTL